MEPCSTSSNLSSDTCKISVGAINELCEIAEIAVENRVNIFFSPDLLRGLMQNIIVRFRNLREEVNRYRELREIFINIPQQGSSAVDIDEIGGYQMEQQSQSENSQISDSSSTISDSDTVLLNENDLERRSVFQEESTPLSQSSSIEEIPVPTPPPPDLIDLTISSPQPFTPNINDNIEHGEVPGDRRRFLCKCNKKFKRKRDLTLHIRKNREEWRFKCNSCNKLFFRKWELDRHLKTTQTCEPTRFEDDQGNETRAGSGNEMVDELVQIPSSSSNLQPGGGGGSTMNQRGSPRNMSLSSHVPCHNIPDGFYHCSCGSQFPSKDKQKRHIQYFTVRNFKCPHCTTRFPELSRLKRHMKGNHKVNNPLAEYEIGCSPCGKMFRTKRGYRTHRKKNKCESFDVPQLAPVVNSTRWSGMSPVRGGMSPMILRLSRRTTRNNVVTQLDDHVYNNGGDNQVDSPPITLSSLQMDQQQQLFVPDNNVHERVNDQNYMQSTSEPSTLRGRPNYYGCPKCSLAFARPEQLRAHLRQVHQSKEMGVKCGQCGMYFSSSKTFHTHRARNECIPEN